MPRGFNNRNDPAFREKWLAALQSDDYRKRRSEAQLGMSQVGISAKGNPLHPKARHFTVRAPNRQVYEITGISEFVRQHPELFDPTDLIKNPSSKRASYGCRAVLGLGSLVRTAERRGQWKGWTVIGLIPS